VHSVEYDARLKRFLARLSDAQTLLRPLGALILARASKAFTDQRRGSREWAPRAVPNVIGILEDLRRGSEPPARRFQARPAGMDRGDLYRSITTPSASRYVGKDTIEVGSTLPYAASVQFGGERDVEVDAGLKQKIAAYLGKQSRKTARLERKAFGPMGPGSIDPGVYGAQAAREDALRKALGWLLRPQVKGFTAKIPSRPFVMVTDEDLQDFRTILFREATRL
jgi:phage gpG-like protein